MGTQGACLKGCVCCLSAMMDATRREGGGARLGTRWDEGRGATEGSVSQIGESLHIEFRVLHVSLAYSS